MIEKVSNKYKILELLKGNELAVKEIADKTSFSENEVRTYIHRLLKDKLIKNIGKKNSWVIYTASQKESMKVNIDLIDKLVLLMIKAKINSENYGIFINESEIESSIKRIREGGLIG